MRALRFHGKGDLRIDKVSEPEDPGPGDVIVKVSACGICGTDLHEYMAGPILISGKEGPQTLGHEFSGTVVAAGDATTSVKVGDRVAIQPLIAPVDDFYARRGYAQLSDLLGIVGLVWPWGGFSGFVQVPARNVGVLSPGVSDEQGALIEPAAVVVHAMDRGRVTAGSSVLITGGGPIGALAALAASAAGATCIIVSETNPVRREQLKALGVVTAVVDPTHSDALGQIRRLTENEQGVDVAVECVGHAAALGTCVEAVRRRGTIVQVGLSVQPGPVDISAIVMKDLTIEGCWCYPTTAWPRVINLVASGKFPVEKVISDRISLDEAVSKGFNVLTKPGVDKLKVLVRAD